MILDDTPVSMAWQASEGEHASGYIPKFVSKAAACRSTSWNCGRSSEASGERSLALNGACQGYSHNDAPSAEEVRKRVKCRDSWDHRSHFQRVSGFPKPLWRCDTRHLRRALFLGSLLELPGWLFKGLTAGRCLVDGCFRHCAGPQQILSCGRYCQQPRIRVLVLIVRLEFSQIVQNPNILGSDDLTCIGSSFRWTCCALIKPQPEVESHAIPEVESLDQSLHAFGLASALPMRDTDGAVKTWDVQKMRRWAPFYIERRGRMMIDHGMEWDVSSQFSKSAPGQRGMLRSRAQCPLEDQHHFFVKRIGIGQQLLEPEI